MYDRQGDPPAEPPIPIGARVKLPLSKWRGDEWKGSDTGPVGTVKAVNYGRSVDDPENLWWYHVVWDQDVWEFTAPDGSTGHHTFTSEPGRQPGDWPHPWRHDMLEVIDERGAGEGGG